ncbi:putative RNA polymerase ECF-type sigma factor containing TPR repeat [Alcanivorax hongdengensis A-11-3]|uniref:Putative RNA polymerase ECF-type sigma factor containing TPR repeat n=1 Tax=Alcanivorax hongdengensis A-11-3 TaxID=1177179 RepID=L0WG23_9GAMM|nr:RNA polymerase sigma factor [Alcanivorax hongdengensis]EKF74775.1 putative RNA polymerase ECF-type sigma factor containing TPR repeat [Alcanivorax hongdengensis A-11-3]
MPVTDDGDTPTVSERDIDALFRRESRRVLATLIRLLGDFDLAEDALQDAFMAALRQWPTEGVPASPRAWLVSAGRFKAIDQLRRRARFDRAQDEIAAQLEGSADDPALLADDAIGDDRLRLIFTCCHPALAREAQVALTLREVCGLTTEEIARAFLSKPATLAQRIVRAKQKIRSAGIPYDVPGERELGERLAAVLQVIYLVFNEGYLSAGDQQVLRHDLAEEAIRLAELLVRLLPEPEACGLLALMLLHHSRRHTRLSDSGELILLEQQDRRRWDRQEIARGDALVRRALLSQRFGPYTLQAAIAAVHALAPDSESTDWAEIVGLYDLLYRQMPSAVVALNRAVAVAMRDGPGAGLELVEALLTEGELGDYHLAHAARADLCRRLGLVDQARDAYQRALTGTQQPAERRFLEKRLAELAEK